MVSVVHTLTYMIVNGGFFYLDSHDMLSKYKLDRKPYMKVKVFTFREDR